MTGWRCEERVTDRNYRDPKTGQYQRANFRAGYSDGFHGHTKWSGSERGWYPEAYEAGWAMGVHDFEQKCIEACERDEEIFG